MVLASPRAASLALTLLLASLAPACGDDSSGETGAETTPATSTSGSTTDSDPGTTTTATTLDSSTGSTAAGSTAADTTAGTGPVGDPTYPPPDGGTCPNGSVPVLLPGAELCAPFCDGEGSVCPSAATGDATSQCTPFAGAGGSGDACDDATPCPAGEVCRSEGTCGDVAFWACQLFCGMGEACPDDMACSGIGTCGYP